MSALIAKKQRRSLNNDTDFNGRLALNLNVKEGGSTIEYRDQDPPIRKMFQDQLAKEGAQFNMPEEACV